MSPRPQSCSRVRLCGISQPKTQPRGQALLPWGPGPATLPPSQSQCPRPHHHQLPGLPRLTGVALSHSVVPAGPVEGLWAASALPGQQEGLQAGQCCPRAPQARGFPPARKTPTLMEVGPAPARGHGAPNHQKTELFPALLAAPCATATPHGSSARGWSSGVPSCHPPGRVGAFCSDTALARLPRGSGWAGRRWSHRDGCRSEQEPSLWGDRGTEGTSLPARAAGGWQQRSIPPPHPDLAPSFGAAGGTGLGPHGAATSPGKLQGKLEGAGAKGDAASQTWGNRAWWGHGTATASLLCPALGMDTCPLCVTCGS